MKYCPYCGSDLPDEDVVFCPECGRRLSGGEKKTVPEQKQHKEKEAVPDEMPQTPRHQQEPSGDPDEGYDGYYDDIVPSDEGGRREGIDGDVVRKIVLLAAGVLCVIGVCVAFMYLS